MRWPSMQGTWLEPQACFVKRLSLVGLITVCLTTLVSGCAPKPYMGEAVDLHSEMGPRAQDLTAPQLHPSPGALGPEAPYLPLVRPPQVQRVWVTAHLNDDGDLIGGHWVYVMLSPSQWLLRGYRGPEKLRLKLPAPIAPESREK